MDDHKPIKQDHPEDELKTGNCSNAIESLLNMESILCVPALISSIPGYSNDNSLIVNEVKEDCGYGVLKGDEVVCVIKWSANRNRVIVADLKKRVLEMYENRKRIDMPTTQAVIDLDANGRRWEGVVNNGIPYGYGVVYDEEGRKEYDGFKVDGMNTCYGTEYYSDISKVKFKGCYYNSNRFGRGTLYDRNGVIDYDGLWKNDMPYSPSFDGNTIDSHTESISVPYDSFNTFESFILPSFLHSLKQIAIRDDCYEMVRFFELNGLSELESLEIGQGSFTCAKTQEDVWNSMRTDGTCRIMNCPKLRFVQTGFRSFSDYHFFELTNLPSLQSIDIGSNCFPYVLSFSLIGMIG